jgi:hypothetical protein
MGITNIFDRIDHIDFVAIAISGWHLSVIYSYLISASNKLNGVIYINKTRISEDMIVDIDGTSIMYVDLKELKCQRNIKYIRTLLLSKNNTQGKELRLLTPFGFNLSFFAEIKGVFSHRNFRLIRFDEGIGSYLSEMDFNLVTDGFFGSKGSALVKAYIKSSIKKTLLERLKCNRYNMESYFLFSRTVRGLMANEDVVSSLKDLYKKFAGRNTNYQTQQILIFKDNDKGRMQNRDIIDFYTRLIETLSLKNRKIYIKKHPDDNDQSFNQLICRYDSVEVINNSLDAEMLYSLLDPVITVGGVSTCCFSIPIIFDKVVYNISPMYKMYKIAPVLQEEMMLRRHYFPNDDRIVFVDSFEAIN